MQWQLAEQLSTAVTLTGMHMQTNSLDLQLQTKRITELFIQKNLVKQLTLQK